MDPLAVIAREAHRKSQEHVLLAGKYRRQRNLAIRRLYSTGRFSYTTLAEQVGCTRELVAKIVQGVHAS